MQGIMRCRERTRQSVWWPGMSQEYRRSGEKLPRVLQGTETESTAIDTLHVAWSAITNSHYWLVWMETENISTHHGLLLMICRDCTIDPGNCRGSHHTYQEYLCTAWYSGGCHLWQWASVCIRCVCHICQGLVDVVPKNYESKADWQVAQNSLAPPSKAHMVNGNSQFKNAKCSVMFICML